MRLASYIARGRTSFGAIVGEGVVDFLVRHLAASTIDLGKGLLKVLHVILHSTLDSSRNAIVKNRVFSKEKSKCIPVTIIYRIAVPRENILDCQAA